MEDVANDLHDAEIYSIESNRIDKTLKLFLQLIDSSAIKVVFKNVVHFNLSSFEIQNVLYQLHFYKISELPDWLEEDYVELDNLKSYDLTVAFIDPSVGMGGIVVFSSHEIQPHNVPPSDTNLSV